MSDINNGGPAFPVPGLQHDDAFNGMTLRDYLAAAAMPLAWKIFDEGYSPDALTPENIARGAYQMADAMLAARRRSPELEGGDGPGEEDGPWAEGWEQRCVAYRVLKES